MTGIDTTSYEISINTTTPATGTILPIGAGTFLNGTFQELNVNRGLALNIIGVGTGGTNVTVEIREKLTPANTTGVATFTLRGTVT